MKDPVMLRPKDRRTVDWTHVVEAGPPDRRFLRPAWYNMWEDALGQHGNWGGPMHHLIVDDQAGDACVLPFSTQKAGPFRFASLCGSYFPSRGIPYSGDPDRIAPRLADAMSAVKCAGFRMGPVPQDNPLLCALKRTLGKTRWKVLEQKVGTEFVLQTPGNGEQFTKSLSSKRRKRNDYYWRKLCEAGPTELIHHTGPQTDWSAVFLDIRQVEAASWVADRGEPRFLGKENEKYWEGLLQDDWFCHAINVWIIHHDQKPVSFALTIDSGKTRYVYANSFDEAVAKYSTGLKIYHQLILDAFTNDFEEVNIGLGDSGYKSGWGAQPASTLIDVIFFPPTARGILAYGAARLQNMLKTLKSSHRQSS